MKIVNVKLGTRSYQIINGFNILEHAGKHIKRLSLGADAYVITNPLIQRLHGKRLARALKKYGIKATFTTVADSEKSKSLKTCSSVIRDLAKFDHKRKVFVIAFGGGVIGDLAGFIAAIYKRGVPYVQIPTTLLACVDSSIGGKTAVDLQSGKNLVGAFYQPRLVISELSLLESLSPRQLRAGLAEIIKYAVIKDKKFFAYLESSHNKFLSFDKPTLLNTVSRCAKIKSEIVAQDEREQKGLRLILNFGHTLGHAIETAAGYRRYNHGEAIAIGMVLAGQISKKIGLLSQNSLNRITDLISATGLPISAKGISKKKILAAHYHDKKFIGKTNRFVLVEDIGKTVIKQNLPLKIIRDSLI